MEDASEVSFSVSLLSEGTVVVGVAGAGEEATIVEAEAASMMTLGGACRACRV